MAETYVDINGDTQSICYGLCDCNVWPISFDSRFPYFMVNYTRCGRCGVKPDLLDPVMFGNKQAALDLFYENFGHYPDPFGE